MTIVRDRQGRVVARIVHPVELALPVHAPAQAARNVVGVHEPSTSETPLFGRQTGVRRAALINTIKSQLFKPQGREAAGEESWTKHPESIQG